MVQINMLGGNRLYILAYIMVVSLGFDKAVEIGPDAPSEILTSSENGHYGGWMQHEPPHFGDANYEDNPHHYSPQNDMHNALNYGGFHAPTYTDSNSHGSPPQHETHYQGMHHQGGGGMHNQVGGEMHHQSEGETPHQSGGEMHHQSEGETHHQSGGEMHHQNGGEMHHNCGGECGEKEMSHHTSPYNDGHHAHHGEPGDHGGDHEVDMYGNEINYHGHALVVGHQYKGHHHQGNVHMPPPLPPTEDHEQEVIPNADPQHIGQIGSFQEPGLGGHGPYRGPTSHHYCHDHHDEPCQVVIRPPPPEHGQNPYEVLTSSQLHPPPHPPDDTIVQMQWQDPHSQGEHYGPVYNVKDPERNHMSEFDNLQYRRCKNKKCKKRKTLRKSSNSVFDLINKNKVKTLKSIDKHNKNNVISNAFEKMPSQQKVKTITKHTKRNTARTTRNKILKHSYQKIGIKAFLEPDSNPYNHRVVGALGELIPQATHRKNHSALESNTNNFELGDQRHYDAAGSLRPPTPFGEEENQPYSSDDHHPPSSREHYDDGPNSYDDDKPSSSFADNSPSSFDKYDGPSSHHHHKPHSREHDGPFSSYENDAPSSLYENERPSYNPHSFDNDDDRSSREHDSPSSSYDDGPSFHEHHSPSNSYNDGPSSHSHDSPSSSYDDGPSSREHDSPSSSYDDGPSSHGHYSPSNSYDDGPSSREHDSPSSSYGNNRPSSDRYDRPSFYHNESPPFRENQEEYQCDKRGCIRKKKTKKKRYDKKKTQRKQRKIKNNYSSKRKRQKEKKFRKYRSKHHKKSIIHPHINKFYKSKKPLNESPKKKTIFPIDHAKTYNFYNAYDRYSQRYYPQDITDKRLDNERFPVRVSKSSPVTEFLPSISFYQPVQHQQMYDLFEQKFTDDYLPVKHTVS